ncbi:TIGR03792 family protein [Leptolyngbya sp. PCC 6406]|uniref:TIGR03792 family protein n=1 Tax=Leptolyngbya sp. PCC 6406 TaxID=1173264 RepID=UPI0002ACDE19|nr:TIGR03792 family protein [Leptolyngbya sp. PCC 6406]
MVIEWLEFRVPADQRERYVQLDEEIWTPALRRYPGFLSKETWLDPTDAELVSLMIRWRSREEWKAISETDLTAIEVQFDQALGVAYTLENAREFQVRRFPVGPRAD